MFVINTHSCSHARQHTVNTLENKKKIEIVMKRYPANQQEQSNPKNLIIYWHGLKKHVQILPWGHSLWQCHALHVLSCWEVSMASQHVWLGEGAITHCAVMYLVAVANTQSLRGQVFGHVFGMRRQQHVKKQSRRQLAHVIIDNSDNATQHQRHNC